MTALVVRSRISALNDLTAPGVPMIRSVLTLRAAAGQSTALEMFYEEHEVLQRAREFAGCRDAVLLRAAAGGRVTHLVIADWATAADYQRWAADPWRVALSQQLAALLDTGSEEPIVGELYEFVEIR
jgi:antibiotic biosynthesis monooxygenase (ABM) superfamily enzyme